MEKRKDSKTKIIKYDFDVVYGRKKKYVKTYFHDLKKDKDLILPIHAHNFFEINIVFEGEGTHIFNDTEFPVQQGNVFVIPPKMEHSYYTNKNLIIYHILLNDVFLKNFSSFYELLPGKNMLFHIEPNLRSNIKNNFYLQLKKNDFEEIENLINMVENAKKATYNESDIEQAIFVLALVTSLIRKMYFYRTINTQHLNNPHSANILNSILHIENHYEEKIDFEEEAKNCNLSYSTYVRIFKTSTGFSPTNYQLNIRIKKAKYLLKNSNETIMNIALSCGFFDSSHFIRSFKKVTGTSPTNFRNKY